MRTVYALVYLASAYSQDTKKTLLRGFDDEAEAKGWCDLLNPFVSGRIEVEPLQVQASDKAAALTDFMAFIAADLGRAIPGRGEPKAEQPPNPAPAAVLSLRIQWRQTHEQDHSNFLHGKA